MPNTFFQFMDFVERFPSGYGTSGDAAGALNTLYPCAFWWRTPPFPNGLECGTELPDALCEFGHLLVGIRCSLQSGHVLLWY